MATGSGELAGLLTLEGIGELFAIRQAAAGRVVSDSRTERRMAA